MTKEDKLYKLSIMGDLDIAFNYAGSEIKQYRLLAAYHAQQALEKTIKLKAQLHGVSLWGHDIRKLLADCEKNNIEIKPPALVKKNADMYTDWEVLGRYSPSSVVNKNSIYALHRVVKEWLETD